jgi:hypothetical protein
MFVFDGCLWVDSLSFLLSGGFPPDPINQHNYHHLPQLATSFASVFSLFFPFSRFLRIPEHPNGSPVFPLRLRRTSFNTGKFVMPGSKPARKGHCSRYTKLIYPLIADVVRMAPPSHRRTRLASGISTSFLSAFSSRLLFGPFGTIGRPSSSKVVGKGRSYCTNPSKASKVLKGLRRNA